MPDDALQKTMFLSNNPVSLLLEFMQFRTYLFGTLICSFLINLEYLNIDVLLLTEFDAVHLI